MPSTGSINAEGKEQRGSAAHPQLSHSPQSLAAISKVMAIPAGIQL